jgi:SAM-dependent methyltransferase
MTRVHSGTEGYAAEAPALLVRYEAITFEEAHAPVLHLMPPAPARVLDVGSGTGRDAAALDARGYQVVAAEPTDAMRLGAMRLHPSPSITWLKDGLPELTAVRERGGLYDLIMFSAVWMHLDADQRSRAMPRVAALLADSGVSIMTLRHGPVPAGRRMFEVSPDETVELGAVSGLTCIFHSEFEIGRQPGVTWTRLVFQKR